VKINLNKNQLLPLHIEIFFRVMQNLLFIVNNEFAEIDSRTWN